MNALRGLLVLAGASLLAGCNMVVSDEPWLVRSADTPVMKPGVWVDAGGSDCEYDVATPAASWPECAQPAIIRADGSFLTPNKDTGKWQVNDVVLGKGDPIVVQVALPKEIVANNAGAPRYLYLSMRPIEHDAEGQITSIETWIMQCGPLDPVEAASGDPEASVTKEPFEGLTVTEGNCRADGIASLTNAAVQSEAIAKSKGGAKWVKEVEPVETE